MRNGKRGMTLVELVVAMCITVIVIGATCALFFTVSDGFRAGIIQAKDHQEAVLAEGWLHDALDDAIAAEPGDAAVAQGVSFYYKDDAFYKATNGNTLVPRVLRNIKSVRLTRSKMGGAQVMNYVITGANGYELSGGIVLNNITRASGWQEEGLLLGEGGTEEYVNVTYPAKTP